MTTHALLYLDESFDAVVPVSISPVRPITATSTSEARPPPQQSDNFQDFGEIVETTPAAISYGFYVHG